MPATFWGSKLLLRGGMEFTVLEAFNAQAEIDDVCVGFRHSGQRIPNSVNVHSPFFHHNFIDVEAAFRTDFRYQQSNSCAMLQILSSGGRHKFSDPINDSFQTRMRQIACGIDNGDLSTGTCFTEFMDVPDGIPETPCRTEGQSILGSVVTVDYLPTTIQRFEPAFGESVHGLPFN